MRASSDAVTAPQGGVRTATAPVARLRAPPRLPKAILAPVLLLSFPPLRGSRRRGRSAQVMSPLSTILLPCPRSHRLLLTFLPCFACSQARTSISPTGPQLCPRLGWVLDVPCRLSPAHHCVHRFGAVRILWNRFPAIHGRAPLPLLSDHRLIPCRVGVVSDGGFGAQRGLLRNTPLLLLTG